MGLAWLLVGLIVVCMSCVRAGFTSLSCKHQTCSGHGICRVHAGERACVCDPGYENRGPLSCVLSPPSSPDTSLSEMDGSARDACVPRVCPPAPMACGIIDDGCGRQLYCGTCLPPAVCGGDGNRNRCGVPTGWYGVDDSDFGPWSSYLTWSSASGGGISQSAGWSRGPTLILDRNDLPVVMWLDDSARSDWDAYLKRFDGTTWVELDGSGSAGGVSRSKEWSYAAAMTVDHTDMPVVAWSERSAGSPQIYVKRFDGNRWHELGTGSASGGGISQTASWSRNPTVGIDGDGMPVVAWSESIVPWRIYAKRFNGTIWEEFGAGSAAGGGISGAVGASDEPKLAFGAGRSCVLVWQSSGQIHVKQYQDSGWQELRVGSATGGGISDTTGRAAVPDVDLDSTGKPTVAWMDDMSGNNEIYIKRFDGAAWREVSAGSATGGGVSQTPQWSSSPSVALDGNGLPIVGWREEDAQQNVHLRLRRLDQTGVWQTIDSPTGSGKAVSVDYEPSLALTASGMPVVAWGDTRPGMAEIYVKRYDGNTWQELGARTTLDGGLSQGTNAFVPPSLALHGSHIVLASASSRSSNREIVATRYDGTSWKELGPEILAGGISDVGGQQYGASMVLDPAGLPVVAWTDDTDGKPQIYVRRYDGNTWTELGSSASGGGISQNAGKSYAPSLAIDASGMPIVAWCDTTPGTAEIYVRGYDGTGWRELGPSSASSGGISQNAGKSLTPSLILDLVQRPVVVWMDDTSGTNEIYGKRFDGSAWQALGTNSASGGGISQTSGASFAPRAALDGTGKVVVAWMDDTSGNYEIYLRQLVGDEWRELGVGSASGGGISQTSGRSGDPSVSFGSGIPAVAWSDETSGQSQIYVKRFDGGAWVEAPLGSASGGGVSNSSAPSMMPALATDSERLCVAWQEMGATSTQVLMRCAR